MNKVRIEPNINLETELSATFADGSTVPIEPGVYEDAATTHILTTGYDAHALVKTDHRVITIRSKR